MFHYLFFEEVDLQKKIRMGGTDLRNVENHLVRHNTWVQHNLNVFNSRRDFLLLCSKTIII